jgi:hypothetical protein
MAAHHVLDDYYLAITLLVTVGYQLLGFSIAFTCQFDKLTGKPHITYCTSPLQPTNPCVCPYQTSPAAQTSSSSPS